MPKIIPTIGRVVLVRLAGDNLLHDADHPEHERMNQPYPGLINFVRSETSISVAVFAPHLPVGTEDLELVDTEADAPSDGSSYAFWMPYQQAQASAAAQRNTEAQEARNEELRK